MSFVNQFGAIHTMGNGVYTAEAISPTGEKVYFAMETLETSDREKWEFYRNMATMLVQGGQCQYTMGSIAQIGSLVNDDAALRKFLATRKDPDFWTSDSKRFEQLCERLRQRKIQTGSPKAEELKDVSYGSLGLSIEQQTHVVYASKAPVKGRIHFVAQTERFGFARVSEMYGDLIMSVGVSIGEMVENRGIFRNPLSIIEGGYGSLAMMIHSFTCSVAKEHFPQVTTFNVRPLKKMGEIFFNKLPKHLITIDKIQGSLYTGNFERERDICVPVELLANLKISL